MAKSGVPRHELPHNPPLRSVRDRATVEDVCALVRDRVGRLPDERVGLHAAAGRVLATAVRAHAPVPPFDRAAMDGYAVRGEETLGATVCSPARFRCVGRARPGRACAVSLGPGEAVEIATGAPMPRGADAVVKVESTRAEGTLVLVGEPAPPGRHVGTVGEDVAPGTLVLPESRILRPQDLGLLAALGMAEVRVVRQPVATVIATGDELVAPGARAGDCQIVDTNSIMLAALLARDGAQVRLVGPLADDRARIGAAIAEAATASDLVLISGGSSAGPEDHAPGLVAELGELAIHGVALRPASPAGVGFIGRVPLVLLPGNPVSCLCAYDFFAGLAARRLGGRADLWPYRPVERPLARALVSAVGRVDYARVQIDQGRVEPLATSGASILSTTSRADGFVVVPAHVERYPVGNSVTVWLYDAAPPTIGRIDAVAGTETP